MLRVCSNVLDAIGQTPLIRLNRVCPGVAAKTYIKLEMVNPGGSVKDRVAAAMIEDAEKRGALKPGGTIIEATSGNTGVGLAMVAAVKGYRCIFIMPDKMSAEKTRLLKAYGAEVIYTPAAAPSNAPDGYSGVAARLLNEIPNSWQPNQFSNMVNPEYHYRFTGPEIWEQTEGKITTFVAGIGTGGTISGVGRFLKEKNPKITVVGADPEGSVLAGGTPGAWAVEGVGEDYVPKTFNAHVVDEWIKVSDADAFAMARNLARMEGMLVGGSAGMAVHAAVSYAYRLSANDVVVALSPDTGRNYLSKFHSDEWMAEKGYTRDDSPRHTLRDLIESQGRGELISVSPEDTAEAAIGLLRRHGISQLPVLEHGRVVGSLRELTLARLLHAHGNPMQVQVREIMARPLPSLDESTQLDEAYRLLMSGNSGVVVTRNNEITGIITRIDLVNFWDVGNAGQMCGVEIGVKR